MVNGHWGSMQTARITLSELESRTCPVRLDPWFGDQGQVAGPSSLIPAAPVFLAVAPDQFTYVAASVGGSGGTADVAISRYTPSGSLDLSFGTQGSAVVAFDRGGSREDRAAGIALDGSGAIVVAATVSIGGSNTDWGVARLLPTGQPDLSFGTNGQVVIGFDRGGTLADQVAGLVVLPDRRIVVGGTVDRDATGNTDFAAARLSVSGQLDPGFSGTGLAVMPFDLGGAKADAVRAVARDSQNRILLAGSVARTAPGDTDFGVVRLTTDGLLDTTFGASQSGRVVVPLDGGGGNADSATGLALTPDGHIVVAGWTERAAAGDFDFAATRLTTNGSVDSGFGIAGRIRIPVNLQGQSDDRAFAVTLDGRGRAILVGESRTPAGSRMVAVRLTPAGQPDASFAPDGVWAIPLANLTAGDARAFGVAVRPNGRILIAGSAPVAGTLRPLLVQARSDLGLTQELLLSGPPDGLVHRFATTLPGISPTVSSRGTVTAFAGEPVVVRSVSAEVNGDGIPDLIVGTGPGRSTLVRVLDGATGTELVALEPFEASFTGGVFVAAFDLDGDGRSEVAITPDEGGGPRVQLYRGVDFVKQADFFGIGDPDFRGGARVALGDLNADGVGDLVVAAGFGGGPRIAAYDGAQLTFDGGPKLFGDFFVFEPALRNGVYVAVGDLDGDGFADLVAGAGPGGGPRVLILSGQSLVQPAGPVFSPVANFLSGDVDGRGGIRVAVKDLDGDDRADLVTGSGENQFSQVPLYRGSSFPVANGLVPTLSQMVDPWNMIVLAGVFVG